MTDQTAAPADAGGAFSEAQWIRALEAVHQDCDNECEHRMLLNALAAAREEAREAGEMVVQLVGREQAAREEARFEREQAVRSAELHESTLKAFAVFRARAAGLTTALEEIKTFGQVCPDFELCKHESCRASYSAWAVADAALASSAGARETVTHDPDCGIHEIGRCTNACDEGTAGEGVGEPSCRLCAGENGAHAATCLLGNALAVVKQAPTP